MCVLQGRRVGHAKDTPTECFLQLRPTDMGERLVMGWRDPAQDVTQHEGETGDLSQREAERQAGDPSFKMALPNSGVLQKPVGPGRQAGWGQQRSPRLRGS